MKKILGLLLALAATPALGQNAGWPPPAGAIAFLCVYNVALPTLTTGQVGFAQCDNHGQLLVSGGGGGGGLSVTDQTAWTQGTSAFTPSGGVYNDTATLSSGQEGTFRLTTKRGQIVDVDSSGNQLHADLIAPIAAGTNLIGGTTGYFGTTASVNEPCKTGTKITNPISQAASGVIITHSGSLKTYICGGVFNISDAESVSLTEGTGSTCGTGAAALMGSTTVANGMALSANEGFSLGNGNATNIVSKTGGDDICMLQSATGRGAGWVTFVQQ